MTARIVLYCDRESRYGTCTASLLTDALTLAEARQAADRQGWNTHPDGPDYCPNCSGSRRVRPGAAVVTLHPDKPQGDRH